MIYLDNAATTFPKPEAVYEAMDQIARECGVNAGRGAYALARRASTIIEETKSKLRMLIHAQGNAPVVFAPSITVALNQIINGYGWKTGDVVYLSPHEHNAVARTLHYAAEAHQLTLRRLPMVDETGEIDLEKMSYQFSKEPPTAIFCVHVSNVTGYILPVKEIFAEGKKYGSFNVLDTAQSLGLVEVDVRENPAMDVVAFAGHKCLYGPFGIGGFINVSHTPFQEYLVGGTGSNSLSLDMPDGEETKYESASCNIVAVGGLHAALDVLDREACFAHEKELTDRLVEGLSAIDGVKLYIPSDREHHIGIVSFTLENMKSDDVGMILDEDYQIAVRTGYHCAPFIHEHLKDEKYLGTVRVSVGRFNTKEDVARLCEAVEEIVE